MSNVPAVGDGSQLDTATDQSQLAALEAKRIQLKNSLEQSVQSRVLHKIENFRKSQIFRESDT